ncbi:regulatory protein, luxR family [Rhizobiales bacterium GAS113]|nr:regulatory protein, luxR family [Rhizobiales bacterium GAS113]
METLGAATEAEMVAEFVRAERDSPRQGARQAAAAERLRTDDPVQLLAATRGYPDQYLFTGFPRNTTWRRVLLLRAEAANIRLYPFEEWKDYTRGTRRGLDEDCELACRADYREYRAFLDEFGLADSLEFMFRSQGSLVAGLNIAWAKGARIPDAAASLADRLHAYVEFNLEQSRVLSAPQRLRAAADRYGLTGREREVAELLCCGRTNREISACLGIGLATVKTHLIHIFEKLGAENRAATVALLSR